MVEGREGEKGEGEEGRKGMGRGKEGEGEKGKEEGRKGKEGKVQYLVYIVRDHPLWVQGVSTLVACYTQSWRQEQAGSRSPRPAKQVYISEWQLSRNQIRIEGEGGGLTSRQCRSKGIMDLLNCRRNIWRAETLVAAEEQDCSVLLPWQHYQNIKPLISRMHTLSPWKPCSLM